MRRNEPHCTRYPVLVPTDKEYPDPPRETKLENRERVRAKLRDGILIAIDNRKHEINGARDGETISSASAELCYLYDRLEKLNQEKENES